MDGIVGLAAFIVVLLALGTFESRRPRQITVASRYIGSLPTGATSVNTRGYLQLLTAAVLVGRLYEANELSDRVNATTNEWLLAVNRANSETAIAHLLAEAGALMIRIQTSDDEKGKIMQLARRRLVDEWVTAYSGE